MISKFRGDYLFLSNFFSCTVTYNCLNYASSEAAYQAQKTLNKSERFRISLMVNPHEAKEAGQKFDYRDDWEDVKLDEMYKICTAKFSQNPDLAKLLLETGDEELVEGNYWNDTFWRVCNGVGENHLGKILMRVRSELR